MTGHEQRFAVDFRYRVTFTRNAFDHDKEALEGAFGVAPFRVFAVIDGGVASKWPGLSTAVERHISTLGGELVAPALVVPGGEAIKNDMANVDHLHAEFHRHGLDRHAYVLVVGGGAVLDAVGYAAATAHRGIRLVRMPSTVLAQNDSGVGVKNSMNRFGIKNFLGTFAPPWAVVCDLDLLETLETRDKVAGMAEAVKVALIRDRAFFEWLEGESAALRRFEANAVETMIRRSAELHMAHIAGSGDAFERGRARPLDYGHWSAHKLESESEHDLRHGEAVAIGMALDAVYAERAGILPSGRASRIIACLRALGLPCHHPALESMARGRLRVLDGLEEFRQHLGGELSITLLADIGVERQVDQVDTTLVAGSIARLSELAGAVP